MSTPHILTHAKRTPINVINVGKNSSRALTFMCIKSSDKSKTLYLVPSWRSLWPFFIHILSNGSWILLQRDQLETVSMGKLQSML